jgi:hypothetical protein
MFLKAHALANKVATVDFLRSKGLPIPEVLRGAKKDLAYLNQFRSPDAGAL